MNMNTTPLPVQGTEHIMPDKASVVDPSFAEVYSFAPVSRKT